MEHSGCQLEGSPLYTSSIVLFSNFLNPSKKLNRFDLALRTDRHVVRRPHTWSLPTIYRFAISSDLFASHFSYWVLGVSRCQQYISLQFPELFVQMERYWGRNSTWSSPLGWGGHRYLVPLIQVELWLVGCERYLNNSLTRTGKQENYILGGTHLTRVQNAQCPNQRF